MIKNEKEIIKLNTDREKYARMNSGMVTTDELMRKIREREEEVRDIVREFDEIEQSFIKRETIYKESNSYIEQITKQINEVRSQNQLLQMKNNKVSIMAS